MGEGLELREFIDGALRVVPGEIAAKLGTFRVELVTKLDDDQTASRWQQSQTGLEIVVATAGTEPHDVAMEALVCLGQALWEKLTAAERNSYLHLLSQELDAGIAGEIDEQALDEKKRLLASRVLVGSPRRLLRYARVSFAATAAEYIHSRWHDVTVREGPEHLPREWIRRRFETLARLLGLDSTSEIPPIS
jgi:hypothetical protein